MRPADGASPDNRLCPVNYTGNRAGWQTRGWRITPPSAGCCVTPSDPERHGKIRGLVLGDTDTDAETPAGSVRVRWRDGRVETHPVAELRRGFHRGETVQDMPRSNTRKTLGPGAVTHFRGDHIYEAGNIGIGTANDRGVAIHVLTDHLGQEFELLAFDCFEIAPHYHYGPRNQDVRIYWDTTSGHTLAWTLDQFKAGNLPNMIDRAGYRRLTLAIWRRIV